MTRFLAVAGVALFLAAPAHAGLTRLLAPPEGESYFGFTFRLWDTTDQAWGDTRPFDTRIHDSITNELAGKAPTFLTVYSAWQHPDQAGKPFVPFSDLLDDVAKVQSLTGPQSVLYLDWTLAPTTAANGGITTKDIASGRLDGYVREYARALRAYAGPVLVRLFGGEFNGSWWYGQSSLANASLTAADFVSAWRRVVDLFRAVGALNVSFAWIPNAFPPIGAGWVASNIDAYYPGDGYVDWAGADIYDVEPVGDLDAVYNFATAHRKPFFLAEWGVRHRGSVLTTAKQRDWIDAMFDYVQTHADVKAINYFNYNSRPTAGPPLDLARLVYLDGGQVNFEADVNDDDHRLLTGFRTTYSARISNPRYVSATRSGAVPVATLLSPSVRGIRATIRWRGNASAVRYDVQLRRGTSAWGTVRSGTSARTLSVRGRRGEHVAVRVRAIDSTGFVGLWSPPRAVVFH
ncbi:MAG: glycosyl hydrolase [Gaiellaceae bacterium]